MCDQLVANFEPCFVFLDSLHLLILILHDTIYMGIL